ncbi:MAG: acyltransferase [Planctomycetales bacterium]|nr:acyltransferase [Planctomycetales bacterium]
MRHGESDSLRVSASPLSASSTAPVSGSAARFVFLDGMRGFAALCIASYHIWRYEPAPYPAEQAMPVWGDWLLKHAWIGVQILLVQSGFVIAYTLRNTVVTPRTALAFVARRLVRLVPPYWVTIALVLAVHGLCAAWRRFPSLLDEPPTAAGVLAQMFYLQDILGYGNLSAGLWTVAIEVQFYVVFVVGWGLSQRCMLDEEAEPLIVLDVTKVPWFVRRTNLLIFFALPAAWALFNWNRKDTNEQWVHHFLFQFFLGMVTWWALERTVPLLVFLGTIAVVAGQMVFDRSLTSPEIVARFVTLATAVSMFIAGRTNHFHDWLNWRWLQYVGRISYSLYLVHYPVGHVVTWLGWLACDNLPTPIQSAVILSMSLVGSIAAGHLLYVAVEVPSVRWAARLKSPTTRVEPATTQSEKGNA